MKIGVPVKCQNGHRATAYHRVEGLDTVYLGVPEDQKCACPKHDIGMGWFQDGKPFVVEPPALGGELEVLTLKSGWLYHADGKVALNDEHAGYVRADQVARLQAEVERLRVALKFYADREHYHVESGNWDTVSGEPQNILWNGEEPDFIEDGTFARKALAEGKQHE